MIPASRILRLFQVEANMKSTLVRISLGLSLLLCMPVGRFAQGKKNDSARYTVTDIGTLGGANSFAYALNGSGSVAGGANIPGQNDLIKQTGFVWYGGLPISVGTLGGPACGANCSSQAAAV